MNYISRNGSTFAKPSSLGQVPRFFSLMMRYQKPFRYTRLGSGNPLRPIVPSGLKYW